MIEHVIEDGHIRLNLELAARVIAAKMEQKIKGEIVKIKVK